MAKVYYALREGFEWKRSERSAGTSKDSFGEAGMSVPDDLTDVWARSTPHAILDYFTHKFATVAVGGRKQVADEAVAALRSQAGEARDLIAALASPLSRGLKFSLRRKVTDRATVIEELKTEVENPVKMLQWLNGAAISRVQMGDLAEHFLTQVENVGDDVFWEVLTEQIDKTTRDLLSPHGFHASSTNTYYNAVMQDVRAGHARFLEELTAIKEHFEKARRKREDAQKVADLAGSAEPWYMTE